MLLRIFLRGVLASGREEAHIDVPALSVERRSQGATLEEESLGLLVLCITSGQDVQ